MSERSEPAAPYGSTLTILVVEDDEAVAELLRTVLNEVSGWGTTVVHDAAGAAEVFRHVQVDVLVVDVNLPGISGLDLLELLRSDPHWRQPPIIMLSARPEQPAVQHALAEGTVTRFLAKPFDVDEVVAAIHEATDASRRADGGQAS